MAMKQNNQTSPPAYENEAAWRIISSIMSDGDNDKSQPNAHGLNTPVDWPIAIILMVGFTFAMVCLSFGFRQASLMTTLAPWANVIAFITFAITETLTLLLIGLAITGDVSVIWDALQRRRRMEKESEDRLAAFEELNITDRLKIAAVRDVGLAQANVDLARVTATNNEIDMEHRLTRLESGGGGEIVKTGNRTVIVDPNRGQAVLAVHEYLNELFQDNGSWNPAMVHKDGFLNFPKGHKIPWNGRWDPSFKTIAKAMLTDKKSPVLVFSGSQYRIVPMKKMDAMRIVDRLEQQGVE